MSDNFKQISKGIDLSPQSADPTSPVDGDFYFSDGTARAIGLWQYKDAVWAAIAGTGGVGSGGSSSLKNLTILGYTLSDETVFNSTFTTDLSGWTVGAGNTQVAPGYLQQTYSGGGGPASQVVATITGRTYSFSGTSRMTSGSGTAFIRIYNGTDSSGTLLLQTSNTTTSWVVQTGSFVATSGTVFIQLYNGGDPVTMQFDDISLKERVPNAYTVINPDDHGKVINIDSYSGNVPVILPAPSAGFIVTIKDYTGNASIGKISVSMTGNLDGAPSVETLRTNYTAATFISNGTNWFRIGRFYGNGILARGIFGGGLPSNSAVIDYISIPTASNATSFGSLSVGRIQLGAYSSAVRGLFVGGSTGSDSNLIDYVSFLTLANATSFGTLTVARLYVAGCGSATRGVAAGGDQATVLKNTIDYVTFATTGNAINFGNLTVARSGTGALSSPTRGVWAGGNDGAETALMDYVTIASTGNATNFGNLTAARNYECGASSSTRGLFAGGGAAGVVNVDYITIATAANAINFGSLAAARTQLAGCSSPLRAVFAGGYDGAGAALNMVYFTIASLGNSTTFGNLTVARRAFGGCSNVHGGL